MCKECSSDEKEKYKCKSCNDGYFLRENDLATSCVSCFIDNCGSCSEYLKCEKCKDGYYLSDSECLSCGIGCNKCNSLEEKNFGSQLIPLIFLQMKLLGPFSSKN